MNTESGRQMELQLRALILVQEEAERASWKWPESFETLKPILSYFSIAVRHCDQGNLLKKEFIGVYSFRS